MEDGTAERPRVRFAPSPTGHLHVGGARTALFNWLFARHEGGVFILRIEDTDRERSRPELTEGILDGLGWLGLEWDEGPLHQADYVDRHRADIDRLLEAGRAYRCFCTPEELEARRQAAGGTEAEYTYDRRCRSIPPREAAARAAAGDPHTVRFRMPEGTTAWHDVVHGHMTFENSEIEDFVILRTDGTPTYNFAVVCDDIAMSITHVIRGADHISNTPKQIQVYHALDRDPPIFCHVPLILGPDGKRLSKRHGATAVGEYRERGLISGAMVNFLALLGWSPGDDREYFEVHELIQAFSLERINRKPSAFDLEKLEWLNGEHLARASGERVLEWAEPFLLAEGVVDEAALRRERPRWEAVMDAVKVRARTLKEVVWQARPFFPVTIEYEGEAATKHWKDVPATVRRLGRLRERLAAVDDWSEASLESAVRGLAADLEIGAGKLIHPLRVALTGMAVSPGIFEVMSLMGRDLVLRRIDEALTRLDEKAC